MLSIAGRSSEGEPSSGSERPLKLLGNRCRAGHGAQLTGVWCLSGSGARLAAEGDRPQRLWGSRD